MARLNSWILAVQLRKFVLKRGGDEVRIVQWIYRPEQAWVRGVFPESPVVYECHDEYSFSPSGARLADIWAIERQLLASADLTFVTVASLLESRQSFARSIRIVTNGIPDFFLQKPDSLEDPLDSIPRPRIGYVGVVRKPMHMKLLRSVFEIRPELQFVIIGPVQSDAGAECIADLPNAHMLGRRPVRSLPTLMGKLDAGLIPYQVNPFSVGLRPLKLAEHLASSIPVVATRMPGLTGMEPLVTKSGDRPVDFVAEIDEALVHTTLPSFSSSAREWAKSYTWSSILNREMVPVLRESLAGSS